VANHPFKELLQLSQEEVLQWFQHPVGQALLAGLLRLQHLEVDRLECSGSSHTDLVDKLFEYRGISYVVRYVTKLVDECRKYHETLRGE
jgi:hypothetical protein